MTRRRHSISWAIVLHAIAMAACSSRFGSPPNDAGPSVRDTGSTVDASTPSVDAFSSVDAFAADDVFAGDDAYSTPDAYVAPPDAWIEPDVAPRCAWVWLDRGGPAFTPHACRPGPGVVDGMLVDPRAFFEALVAGRDPDTWTTVMAEIETELWSCGVGQQRGSGGDVRGRLFLPNGACPDASPPPDDMRAIFLGVRQEPVCWDHPADVVECP